MDARTAQIKNSRSVRLPEPSDGEAGSVGGPSALEQRYGEAGLDERASRRKVDDGLPVEACCEVRAGWGDAARLARERGDDASVGVWPLTGFDTAEWEWESDESAG